LPQLLVIIQVFVTQSQPVDALRQHLVETVLDSLGLAIVGEATGHASE
jgi:hypothetical protein